MGTEKNIYIISNTQFPEMEMKEVGKRQWKLKDPLWTKLLSAAGSKAAIESLKQNPPQKKNPKSPQTNKPNMNAKTVDKRMAEIHIISCLFCASALFLISKIIYFPWVLLCDDSIPYLCSSSDFYSFPHLPCFLIILLHFCICLHRLINSYFYTEIVREKADL